MSASADTVTAEVVMAPIADSLTSSHGWRPPRRPCLLFREDKILVVFYGLEGDDPHVEVFRARNPESCQMMEKITLPAEFYEAAKNVLEGLDKLKGVAPLVSGALPGAERARQTSKAVL